MSISENILKYSLYPSWRGRRTELWRLYQKKGYNRITMERVVVKFFSSYLAGSGIENIGEYFKIFFEPSLRCKRISENILKYSLYPSLRGRRISENILKYSLYPSLRGRRTEQWRLYQEEGYNRITTAPQRPPGSGSMDMPFFQ